MSGKLSQRLPSCQEGLTAYGFLALAGPESSPVETAQRLRLATAQVITGFGVPLESLRRSTRNRSNTSSDGICTVHTTSEGLKDWINLCQLVQIRRGQHSVTL